MPKQLNVDLTFNANTDQAKAAIIDLQNELRKIGNAGTINSANKIFDVKTIKEASQAARELQKHLASATDTNTGKLNLGQLSASLTKSGKDLAVYQKQLEAIGPSGERVFAKLANNIAMAENPTKRVNAQLQQFATTLRNTARWQISSSILHGFMGALQGAYGYAQDLNQSLNNIRIVTGASVEEMSAFADRANKAAQALSTTTTSYTDAALIYYQQGIRDQDEIAGRVETTIKLANVSRQSAEEVSNEMTAIWNNFYDGSKSLEYYADVITALGAATASSSEEISTGLQKFAAIADTVGLSYEYATSALATITATTRQSADTVGTGLRTLFSRLEGLKLGETLEDGVDLNKYSQALQAVGVQVLDTTGELRNMDDILDDLGERWGDLSKAQQTALAQTVGGVRQYTNLIALMDNWDFMQENLGVAQGAEGTLQEQADIYAESWEAAQKRVRAAAEAIYNDLLNDKFFISLTNIFAETLKSVDGLIDGLGGLKGVILAVGAIASQRFAKEMPSVLNRIKEDLLVITGRAQEMGSKMQNSISVLTHQESQSQLSMIRQDSGGSMELAMDLELTSKIAEQKRILNANEAEYSKAEKAHAEEVINGLIAQREELMILGRAYDQLKTKTDSLYDKIFNRVKGTAQEDWLDTAMVSKVVGAMKSIDTATSNLQAKFKSLADSGKTFKELGMSTEEVKDHLLHMAQTAAGLNTGNLQNWNNLVKEITNSENVSEEQLQSWAQKIREFSGQDLNAAQTAITALKNSIENMQGLPPQLKQQLLEYINGLELLGQQSITVPAAMENVIAAAGRLDAHLKTSAESVVKVGGAFMQLSMVLTSLQNAKRVFSNEDSTAIEKITAAIGILTAVSMAYKTVADAELITKGANIIATYDEAFAKAINTTETTALAASTSMLTGAEVTLTGVQAGLNAVMAANPAIAIMLALAALAGVIYLVVKAYNKDADAAKAAAKEAEEFKNKAEEATKAADDLRNSIEQYDSCVEKLNQCTKGTQEWRDALKETGETALETMEIMSKYLTPDEYQDLIQYYRENKTLNEDLVKTAQERADAAAAEAQYESAIADKKAKDADINSQKTNLSRKIANTQSSGYGADATVGTIKANLDQLIGTTDLEDFKTRLQDLGVDLEGISNDTLMEWRSSIESMATEASNAAQTLQVLSEAEVERLLGNRSDTYSQAEKAYAGAQYENIKDLPEDQRKNALDDIMNDARHFTDTFGEEFMTSLTDGLDKEAQTVDLSGYTSTLTNKTLQELSNESDPKKVVEALGFSSADIEAVAESLGVSSKVILDNLMQNIKDSAKDFDDIGKDLSPTVKTAYQEMLNNIGDITLAEAQTIASNMQHVFEATKGNMDAVQKYADFYGKLGDKAEEFDERIAEIDWQNADINDLQKVLDDLGIGANFADGELRAILETLGLIQAEDEAAVSPEERYKAVMDASSGLEEGGTIDQAKYDTLQQYGLAVEDFFQKTADGSYRLIQSSADLQNAIINNDIALGGFTTRLQEIDSEVANLMAIRNDENFNYKDYEGAQAQGTEGFNTQLSTVNSFAEESGIDTTALSEINAAVSAGDNLSPDQINALAEAYGNLGDVLSDEAIDEKLKSLAEEHDQLKSQVEDANFHDLLDADVDPQELEDMAEYIKDNADEIDGLSKAYKGNEKASKALAHELLRYKAASEAVTENFDDWNDALSKNTKDMPKFTKTLKQLENTYGDLLNMDGSQLSEDFLADADNLQLLQEAANGSEEAYNDLQAAAAKDILIHAGADTAEAENAIANLQAYTTSDAFDDITIGAYIDDANAIQAMNELINAADMTATEAQNLLAGMGIDAEVETVSVPESQKQAVVDAIPTVTYDSVPTATVVGGEVQEGNVQVPTINYSTNVDSTAAEGEKMATALRVTKAQKGSGGGGVKVNHSNAGGGGGGGCFVAGTLISTNHGFEKIENIIPGDVVLSYNEQTQQNEYCKVLNTMIHFLWTNLYTIKTENETIEVTGIHRFYIKRAGKALWIPASEIRADDLIFLSSGIWQSIDCIKKKRTFRKVYNFEVDNNHNYYITQSEILVHNKGCFVAGTLITTDNGFRNIESISAGDIVLSYNEENKQNEYSKVIGTMIHFVWTDLYSLYIENEILNVTDVHRFYILRNGQIDWIPASELQISDLVLFADGTWHLIHDIKKKKTFRKVYNFEVSDNHNYYVGNNKILVHNKGCFTAGTLITTNNGYKNIEDIQIGDIVLSYDEINQRNTYSSVAQTMIHFVHEKIYRLHIGTEILQVTGIHRFFIKRNNYTSWIHAEDLQEGDLVLYSNGTWNEIFTIESKVRFRKVYNFEVSNTHNYYVGKQKILAHNKGGGSSRKAQRVEATRAQTKKPTEGKERYHVVQQQLGKINHELDRISTNFDRAFGTEKLKYLDQQIKKQDKLIQKQKEYIKEIRKYALEDKKNLKKGTVTYWSETDQKMKTASAGVENYLKTKVKFGADGTITNYDDIIKANNEAYNKAVAEFNKKDAALVKKINATSKDSKREAYEKQREELQRIMEKAEAQYEGVIAYLDQYEETEETLMEAEQALLDMINAKFDMKLEESEIQIKIKLDIADDKIKLLDHLLVQLGDGAYAAANRIALMGKEMTASMSKIQEYRKGVTDLFTRHGLDATNTWERFKSGDLTAATIYKKMVNNGNGAPPTEAEIDALKEKLDGMIEENQFWLEQSITVIEEIGTVMEDNIDRLDRISDRMEHLKKVANSYKNIVDLTGRDYLGITTAMYDAMEATNVRLAAQSVDMSKQRMQQAKDQYQAVYDGYQAIQDKLRPEEKLAWEERLREATDYVQEMTENYYSTWEEAIEAVQTRWESSMQHIAEDFSKRMAGFAGNLEGLKSQMDLQKEINDTYVPSYEKMYQLSKLASEAQKAIDGSNNVKVQRELQVIQDKILKARQSEGELSKYEIDYLQKELELKKAQLALEEATKVKSQVRMSRDSEGNYAYVYTANEEAVQKAEDEYSAKLYEMQKLNEEYINNIQTQLVDIQTSYISAMQEAADTYGLGTDEYTRAIEAIQSRYQTYFMNMTDQLNIALANQDETQTRHAEIYEELTGDYLQGTAVVTTAWEDTLLATETGIETLEEYRNTWMESTADTFDNVIGASEQWQEDNDAVYEAAGTTISEFSEQAAADLTSVVEQGDEAVDDLTTQCEDANEAIGEVVDATVSWEEQFSESIQRMSDEINEFIALINRLTSTWANMTTTVTLDDGTVTDIAVLRANLDAASDSKTRARTRLDRARTRLDRAKETKRRAATTLKRAARKKGVQTLRRAQARVTAARNRVTDLKRRLSRARTRRAKDRLRRDLRTAQTNLRRQRDAFNSRLRRASRTVRRNWSSYRTAKRRYNTAVSRVRSATSAYNTARSVFRETQADYNEAKAAYDEGKEKFNENWSDARQDELQAVKSDETITAKDIDRYLDTDIKAISDAISAMTIAPVVKVDVPNELKQTVEFGTINFPSVTNKDEIIEALMELINSNAASQYANRT